MNYRHTIKALFGNAGEKCATAISQHSSRSAFAIPRRAVHILLKMRVGGQETCGVWWDYSPFFADKPRQRGPKQGQSYSSFFVKAAGDYLRFYGLKRL